MALLTFGCKKAKKPKLNVCLVFECREIAPLHVLKKFYKNINCNFQPVYSPKKVLKVHSPIDIAVFV